MQSPPPSFRTAVNPYATSLKRARSPGPGADRQVKRIALAFANGSDATSVLDVNCRTSFVASDVSDSCHSPLTSGHQGCQDEWVRQAKDLAICEGAPSGSVSDENMVIDMQPHSHPYSNAPMSVEPSSAHNHHQMATACDHTRGYTMSPPPSAAPFSIPSSATTSSSSTEPSPPPPSSTSSIAPSAARPPAIYFSPATPSSEAPTPPSHEYGFREQDHEFHHQHGTTTLEDTSRSESRHTLLTEGIPMGKSCLPSSPCSSVPGRKQRFTMGPRVDCVKCKMGVKGHWVHLD
ncbi:hypothetical protein EDC04DRAFT_2680366 [Pisolithus marmoratus]|nr:hypothetical protein EDC04DRAFT_2680366 [Pisolithus marmoratus]